MIYTVTFNPSLDYILSVKDFKPGQTNRAENELLLPGGKGINVSMVLQNLGMKNMALGFTAGFTGRELELMLGQMGVRTDFVHLEEGASRINIKLPVFKSNTVEGTEINANGPCIPESKVARLFEQLQQLAAGDILVLAGSIPSSLPVDIYQQIMELIENKGVLAVVDATKELLLNTLPYKPFLIKPNHHELGELFHVELTTREEVIPFARKLQELGAQNVLVSLGEKGAVLAAADGRLFSSPAPAGQVINAVGAGDSMVAGFLYGWTTMNEYEPAFQLGLAAGSASAFSEHLATGAEIWDVYKRMFGEEIF